MDNLKTVGYRDIPPDVYGSITRQIVNYSVGIVKFVGSMQTEDATLIGSGTLIQIKGVLGILTAQHVIDALPQTGNVGFLISEQLHRYPLDAQTLSLIPIGMGENPETGPDLGIIVLPKTAIGTLKANKSFYNVGLRKDEIINKPPDNDRGVWCICGVPDVKTKSEGPAKGFRNIKAFVHSCGFGGVGRSYLSGEFDYFDCEIHYNEKSDLPSSFGGVSGGGLWQVLITQEPNGGFGFTDTILSGVAFYQSPTIDNRRIIKCHGRNSIYSHAYDAIK